MSDRRPPRYLKSMNKVMMAVQKLGIPTGPAMVLTVPGRKSGQPRSTPMTPFDHDGGLYTVAGYPGSDWAANARAAGAGTLSRGRKSRRVKIVELSTEEAGPVLRSFAVKVPVGALMAAALRRRPRIALFDCGTPSPVVRWRPCAATPARFTALRSVKTVNALRQFPKMQPFASGM